MNVKIGMELMLFIFALLIIIKVMLDSAIRLVFRLWEVKIKSIKGEDLKIDVKLNADQAKKELADLQESASSTIESLMFRTKKYQDLIKETNQLIKEGKDEGTVK